MTADNLSLLALVALLPLTTGLLVSQTNPYHALVIRGILGAVAALVYALFGAADVALTEALVGTMLSITLYAVAVRSSMSMRVGILEHEADAILDQAAQTSHPEQIESEDFPTESLCVLLRQLLVKHNLRIEWVIHPTPEVLKTALERKEVHSVCYFSSPDSATKLVNGLQPYPASEQAPLYCLQTRVRRLYDLMYKGIPANLAEVTHVQPQAQPVNAERSHPVEVQS